MLDKILVPLDESALAECTLPHVAAIARAFDSTATLLHVLERNNVQEQVQVDPLDWHLRKVEAQTYLDGAAERGRRLDLSVESLVLEGPAADRVIEYAHEQEFDLIALSSHGRSGLSGWNLSSVVQKIIHRANRSILLVRAYEPGQDRDGVRYRRILAPLDGSQRAESVLPLAIRLARQHEAELFIAHVVARPEMLSRTPLTAADSELVERLIERNHTEAIRYFEQLQSRLPAATQTHLRVCVAQVGDNLASALHHLVDQDEIDLVVLSAHGYTGQSQRPYGSIVTSFITYGATPLLVFQDLPAHEIEPTKAEEAARANGSSRGPRRINA